MFHKTTLNTSFVKRCQGCTLNFRHNSSKCSRCFYNICFYKIKKEEQEVDVKSTSQVFGLITYIKKLDENRELKEDSNEDYFSALDTSSDRSASCLKNLSCNNSGIQVCNSSLRKSLNCADNIFQNAYKSKCQTKQKEKTLDTLPTSEKKAPTKRRSLKRKRWILNQIKNADDYEDDLYEKEEIFRLDDSFEDEESLSTDIPTPKWSISLSPRTSSDSEENSSSCNPTEFSISRKDAEEYQFRRKKFAKLQKMKLRNGSCLETANPPVKEELNLNEIQKTLRTLIKKPKKEKDSGSDDYFSGECDDSD